MASRRHLPTLSSTTTWCPSGRGQRPIRSRVVLGAAPGLDRTSLSLESFTSCCRILAKGMDGWMMPAAWRVPASHLASPLFYFTSFYSELPQVDRHLIQTAMLINNRAHHATRPAKPSPPYDPGRRRFGRSFSSYACLQGPLESPDGQLIPSSAAHSVVPHRTAV